MINSISLWQLSGFAITSVGGTILHFLYEWLGSPWWIASFSGVNESTWEHMKLLFWPLFTFAIFQGFFARDIENFWGIKLRGIILGLVLIPTIFYLYNGIIGKSPDVINIAIFFIAAAAAYAYETHLFKNPVTSNISPGLAISILSVIAMLFIIFTFSTPKISIFKDPITNSYGI